MVESHILRIECDDAKGLVDKITGVLYRNGLNIINNGEFVDREINRFFMRTVFSGHADSQPILKELSACLPKRAVIQLAKDRKKDIILLATKEHHCLGDLLIRHSYGELHANVLAVISNHDTLSSLVKKFDIPYHHVSHEKKTNRFKGLNQALE